MKNKKTIIIVSSILLLAAIGAIGQWITGETPDEVSKVETPSNDNKIDRTRAYVIARQFAKQHLGDVSFGYADDGFEEMGDNNYIITGVADMPGKQFRWTVDLLYKGGEWSDKANWIEKNWIAK